MLEAIWDRVNIEKRQYGLYHSVTMTATDYKVAIAALKMDHKMAAKALGIGVRTSVRYAAKGAPRSIALALEALALKSKGKAACKVQINFT